MKRLTLVSIFRDRFRQTSLVVALGLPCSLGCSSSESGTIELVTGQETDTFTQSPVPVKLEINSIDSSGNSTTVATSPLPATTVDLGSFDPGSAGILQVSGFDDAGTRVVGGQSPVVLFGDIDGITLPLFIQRIGELARLPDPPQDARTSPIIGVIEGRYIVVTGGSDPTLAKTTLLYDLLNLAQVSPTVTLPIVPTSLAFTGFVGWLVNDAGVYQYDFATAVSANVILPSGPSYTDISGGSTVSGPDGSQYIVGATRARAAATAVLAIDANGNPSWMTLSSARQGAAAAWLPGVGVVVTGGSPSAAGAEVIAIASSTGASTGSAYAYPPDPSIGAGAAALDGSHVIIAGGTLPDGTTAGVRSIDLSCTAQCLPVPWASLPLNLTNDQVFAIDSSDAVVIGSELSTGTTPGLTHVYRVSTMAATEVPTKVAHTQAGAIASPIGVEGSVLLLGGASAIESLAL